MELAHFGKFTINPVSRVLLCDGSAVAVEPKVFECIELLVSHAGELVTREQLLRALWPDVHVGDAALRRVIVQARKVLGDRGNAQALIRTRKKLGYVFVGTVVREPIQSRFASTATAPSWPFVGRELELAELRQAMTASNGAGAFCFVTGEAGTGKSTLLSQLRKSVLPGNRAWLIGHCQAGSGVPAFWPWREVTAQLLKRPAVRERLEPLVTREPELARVIPELSDTRGPTPRARPADAEQRFLVCEAFVECLRCLSADQFLFIVIEDVHWADDGTLVLLELLVRATQQHPIFVLVSYRPEEIHADSTLARLIGRTSGRDGILAVHLPGLTLQDVRSLLAALEYPGLAAGTAETLKQLTAGNPLFMQQLVKYSLSAEAPLFQYPPRSFDHVVTERVRGLPPSTLVLLGQAAVLGFDFVVPMLATLAKAPAPRVRSELEPALRMGVLIAQSDADRLQFAHALLKDALYRALPLAERQAHHAEALRARQEHPDVFDTSELASHAYLAGGAVASARRLELCAQAGREAFEALAFDRAVIHLSRALELWPLTGALATKAELALLLARARWEADEPSDRTSRAFFDAAGYAREAGSAKLLAQAAVGCVFGEGSIPTLRATRVGDWEVPLLEEAAEALSTLDTAEADPETMQLEYRVNRALCLMYASAGDRALALAAAQRAVQYTAPSMDAWTRASTLTDSGSEALLACDVERTRAVIEEVTPYCDHPDLTARQRIELAIRLMAGCLCLGDLSSYEAIRESAERAVQELPPAPRFGRLGERVALYTILPTIARVTVATIRGEISRAERLYGSFVAIGDRLRTPRARDGDNVEFLTWLQILGYQGRAGELQPLLEERLAKFPEDAWEGSLAMAQFKIERGALDEARKHFETLRATDFQVLRAGRCVPPRLETQVRMADVCCAVGDAHDAARIYEILLPSAALCAGEGPLLSLGSISRPLAQLCHKLGNCEEACQYFARALAHNQRFGHRPEIVRTRLGHARALCALGRFSEGGAESRAAYAEAQSIGMAPMIELAERLLPEPRR
ncbi:MAG TPA: AAA family ATPase [Polyangiaceae bacterium]|nr:AAA family ATPase [Polyangiaceae bacterium]